MCGTSLGTFSLHGSRRAQSQQRASHVVRADVDYYSVLGVDKSADKKEIKQAYRYCLISVLFQSHVNAYCSMHKVS